MPVTVEVGFWPTCSITQLPCWLAYLGRFYSIGLAVGNLWNESTTRTCIDPNNPALWTQSGSRPSDLHTRSKDRFGRGNHSDMVRIDFSAYCGSLCLIRSCSWHQSREREKQVNTNALKRRSFALQSSNSLPIVQTSVTYLEILIVQIAEQLRPATY